MRKAVIYFFLVALFIAVIGILNIKVSIRQCVDYKCHIIKMPLYIKISEFLSRDYYYRQLVEEIIAGSDADAEKVLKIFEWTHKNIREVPENFPVVDDHILNIIIRGYGTCDQSADVFCMLCEYAGIPAAWVFISPNNTQLKFAISLVKLEGKERIFDTYFGNYFINQNGEIAALADFIAEPGLAKQAKNKPIFQGIEYEKYFYGLAHINNKDFWKRGRPQMPIYRLIQKFKEFLKIR